MRYKHFSVNWKNTTDVKEENIRNYTKNPNYLWKWLTKYLYKKNKQLAFVANPIFLYTIKYDLLALYVHFKQKF